MATTSLAKLEHKNDLMQKRAQKAAVVMEANAEDILRKGAGVAAAGLMGYAKKKGKLQTMWSPFDMPKTLFISGVATGLALVLPKKGIGRYFRHAFNGVGESAMSIGTFEWAAGQTPIDGLISGGGDSPDVSGGGGGGDVEGRRQRRRATQARSLEQKLRAELDAMRRARDNGGGSSYASNDDDDGGYYDSQAAA